nr:hypothetical protein [Gemmatimonadota bacterium]
ASHYVPSLVLAGGSADSGEQLQLLAGRTPRDGIPTAYVCRTYTCDEPATDTARLGQQLEAAGSARRASSSEG